MGLNRHSPSVRLAAGAGILIAGEMVGFAVPDRSGLWPYLATLIGVALLAAYGWNIRHLHFPAIFFIGILLALHTDNVRLRILHANSGMHGPRPALALPVERKAEKFMDSDGAMRLAFPSHVGPLPLHVCLSADGPTPVPGDYWSCYGWISRKPDKKNRFACRTLWTSETNRPVRISSATRFSPSAVYARLSEGLAHRACIGLDWCPETARLNCAILLGARNGLSRARRTMFANAGTIHVFAISGLHVMVIALLVNTFLTRLDMPPRMRGLLTVPLVAVYTVLTGARPSAVRAALMVSLYLLGPVFGRRPDPLAAWSSTALIVYALHPERLFDLGCSLSFVVMFGIVLWVDWSRRYASPFDPKEGEDLFVPPRWWRWGREGLRRLAGNSGVSFAAWLAGVPIAAHAFGRFTPGGLLANLVVIVCANYLVRFGAAGVLVSFICLPLAAICNNLAALCTEAMTSVSERVAELPFSNFEIEPWSLWKCVAWYAFWLAAFLTVGSILPRRVRTARTWWRKST